MELKEKILRIILCLFIMFVGLILFKYIPMLLFGNDILFDASAHVTYTAFVLFVIWQLIEKNKKLRTLYLIIVGVSLIIVSIDRILEGAHNLFGVLLGGIISLIAVTLSRRKRHEKLK